MDSIEELNCNEHVKAHQRQQLIEWLEGVKSERIRQFHEKTVDMPKAKVEIPTPEIVEKRIDISPVMYTGTESIGTSIVDVQSEYNTNYHFKMSTELFENINVDERKIPEPVAEIVFDVDPNNFSNIVAPIVVPKNTSIPKPMIDLSSVDIEDVNCDILPIAINLWSNDFTISKDNSITTLESITSPKQPKSFITDIKISNTLDPKCVDFNGMEKNNPLNIRTVISPMQEIVPKISLRSQTKITAESVLSDNFLPIDLQNISVPLNTEGIEFTIDIKKGENFDIISNIDVPQSSMKPNIEIKPISDVYVPIIEIEDLPDFIVGVSKIDDISVDQVKVTGYPNLKDKVKILEAEIPVIESVPITYISADISIQPTEITLKSQPTLPIEPMKLSEVTYSLPYIDDFPNISVPNQKNTIPVKSTIPYMETVAIPSVDIVHSQLSFPETNNIIGKEMLGSVLDIRVPDDILISKNSVYTVSLVPSMLTILPPNKISIPCKILPESLPKITLQAVSIPDNTSFLENLINNESIIIKKE